MARAILVSTLQVGANYRAEMPYGEIDYAEARRSTCPRKARGLLLRRASKTMLVLRDRLSEASGVSTSPCQCALVMGRNQPAWLTSEVFSKRIQPLLANISNAIIRSRIGVSRWYAGRIREGYRPHPRHWQVLAQLVGISRGV